jgi:ACS family hexuronate transporter-like MFS transporter
LGYAPLFAICGCAYLAALAFIHLMLPKLELAADDYSISV